MVPLSMLPMERGPRESDSQEQCTTEACMPKLQEKNMMRTYSQHENMLQLLRLQLEPPLFFSSVQHCFSQIYCSKLLPRPLKNT